MTKQLPPRRAFALALFANAAIVAVPAYAQDAPPLAAPEDNPPAQNAPPPDATPSTSEGQTSYPASFFARFSPRTAYDMLVQVPGFSIREADNARGLGQASENVLINGQRITDKSGGAVAKLRLTNASSVERIDLTDAARLGIAGLQGLVANVIVKSAGGGKGQFAYIPEFRAHYSNPLLVRGMVSYTNRAGPVEYTLSADDTRSSNRGAFGGPDDLIYDPDGNVIERRVQRLFSDFTQPWFKVATKIDVSSNSLANLSAQYGPYWYDFGDYQKRRRDNPIDDRFRNVTQSQRGFMIDLNGDYEFPVGPGRLKLIGLRHYEHEPTETQQRTSYADGSADDGVRFLRDAHIGETIIRAEYGWKGGLNDWQLTLERAVNTLSQKGRLFSLSPQGDWEEEEFPQGTGDVAEHRYEATATLSRPLSSTLDLQFVAGGEISKLERLDEGHEKKRNFFRPKGSLSLSWRPSKGWDASAKLSRRVGQISFYDFLAQLDLNVDRENAGNPDLVPPQSWELETEVGRELGAWGKARLKLFYNRIDDIIDIVPIGEDGQSIGNLPRAKQWGGELTSTINLDPIGWHGAKLDLSSAITRSRVKDPLTGQLRPISGDAQYSWSVDLRHDIPHSDLAWGANLNGNKNYKNYFLDEISQEWEGPVWGNVFIEHKNVFGMTVQASVRNLLDGRHYWNRDVYGGFRDRSPLIFRERQKQLIGPIFYLSIKGSF